MSTPPHKVLITGADGMLGTYLCNLLIRSGYIVVAMSWDQSQSNNLQNLDVNAVSGDICDKSQMLKFTRGCSTVVHIAASTQVWPSRSSTLWKTNYEATLNLAEVCESNGVERLIYVSSASCFEPGSKEVPGNEKQISSKLFGLDYIKSKIDSQQQLLRFNQMSELDVLCINPTFMIGAFDVNLGSGRMILQLYQRKIPGYSKGGKNFVHTEDVADAILKAIEKGRAGECYIIGNENLNYNQFFKKASSVFKQKFKMMKIPSSVLMMYGAMNSAYAFMLKKKPQMSYNMTRIGLITQFYDSSKARKELGYQKTPIESAITDSIEWYKSNGYI